MFFDIFQNIHQRLRDRTTECETLKQQIEDYAMHVGRVEDLLAQKVNKHNFADERRCAGEYFLVKCIVEVNIFVGHLPFESPTRLMVFL